MELRLHGGRALRSVSLLLSSQPCGVQCNWTFWDSHGLHHIRLVTILSHHCSPSNCTPTTKALVCKVELTEAFMWKKKCWFALTQGCLLYNYSVPRVLLPRTACPNFSVSASQISSFLPLKPNSSSLLCNSLSESRQGAACVLHSANPKPSPKVHLLFCQTHSQRAAILFYSCSFCRVCNTRTLSAVLLTLTKIPHGCRLSDSRGFLHP